MQQLEQSLLAGNSVEKVGYCVVDVAGKRFKRGGRAN